MPCASKSNGRGALPPNFGAPGAGFFRLCHNVGIIFQIMDTAVFDASGWPQAEVYPSAQVDAKMGYGDVIWSGEAAFIWSLDLEQSNTLLRRLTVE